MTSLDSGLGRNADFRQRERHAERTNQRRIVNQQVQRAVRTREAIDRFEEVLKIEKERQLLDGDDLPPEAEAETYGRSSMRGSNLRAVSRGSDHSDDGIGNRMQRSQSDVTRTGSRPQSQSQSHRPNSRQIKQAQQKRAMEEVMMAQTGSGFRKPLGPQYTGESIFQRPRAPDYLRASKKPVKSAVKYDSRPSPLERQDQEFAKSHSERALMAFYDVDQRREEEEKFLEQDSLDMRHNSLASEREAETNRATTSASYGESLPIEVVKVDKQPRSLFDFEKAFEKFRRQQRELLEHHNESERQAPGP